MKRRYFSIILLFLTSQQFVSAREWTNSEGKKIEADLISSKDGKVSLMMNGKQITYPLANLSEADQEFIKAEALKAEAERTVKTGYLKNEKMSSRFFPTPSDYFKDSDRKKWLSATEATEDGPENKGGMDEWMARDEEKDLCNFYVPADYKKGEPGYGLLLVINPSAGANIPANWFPILDELKLIAVSAANVGNDQSYVRRVNFSMDALATARERFAVPEGRQIVTGLSGGGHMAMLTGAMYPEVFQGAISNAAQSYLPQPESYSHFAGLDVKDFKSKTRKNMRWVVVSGEKDKNYAEIKKTTAIWLGEKLNYRFIDVPGMAHTYATAEFIKEAIQWVEAMIYRP